MSDTELTQWRVAAELAAEMSVATEKRPRLPFPTLARLRDERSRRVKDDRSSRLMDERPSSRLTEDRSIRSVAVAERGISYGWRGGGTQL